MDYKLTELIELKAFEELSETEKRFVLEYLSEAEFRERSEMISKVKNELKSEGYELKASEHSRVTALAALRSKHAKKKSGFIPVMLTYKIPVWTSIAAIFLVFILTTPFIFNEGIGEVNTSERLTLTDTVYVEKIVKDTIEIVQPADTVVKTVYRPIQNTSTTSSEIIAPIYSNDLMTIDEREFELTLANEEYSNPVDLKKPSSGKSLSDDPFAKILLGISQQ
tara:strand:- start:115841 stop:116509 length:669 start_codon:yes stop_codon:yes gene_type:complete